MSEPIGVGVIGVGGMGARHAANLAHAVPGARVSAVMDADRGRAEAVARACDGALALDEAQALVEHPAVDAVVVASPDRFHAGLAVACIAAGKPVLCEKPLATGSAQALTVVEAETAAGRRLVQVGFMREFDEAHTAVKRIVAGGDLGRALVFRGVHVNAGKDRLRTVEEVMSNSVVHDIHSARWLMDDEIVQVAARTIPGAADRPDTARCALVQLAFRHGGLGTIECNSEAGYGYEVDVRITGECAAVETTSLRAPVVSRGGRRGQWVEDDWLQRFEAAYLAEALAWVRSVAGARAAGPSAWDGYVSLVVADACAASARGGGVPVDVATPAMPALYARG